jgi:hypothetical protein
MDLCASDGINGACEKKCYEVRDRCHFIYAF